MINRELYLKLSKGFRVKNIGECVAVLQKEIESFIQTSQKYSMQYYINKEQISYNSIIRLSTLIKNIDVKLESYQPTISIQYDIRNAFYQSGSDIPNIHLEKIADDLTSKLSKESNIQKVFDDQCLENNLDNINQEGLTVLKMFLW